MDALSPNATMETHLLALQAKVLLWTGLGWLAIGLWLGYDPITVGWRAALAAMIAMWFSGKLLHLVGRVIEERAATDAADAQMAAEQAVATVAKRPVAG